jgi:hypothetical protein
VVEEEKWLPARLARTLRQPKSGWRGWSRICCVFGGCV